jgi:hypothetical protein
MSSCCSLSDLVTDLLFGPWHYLPVQSLCHTHPWSPLPAPRLIALFLLVFVSEVLIFDINTEMLLIMMDEISRAHKRVSR